MKIYNEYRILLAAAAIVCGSAAMSGAVTKIVEVKTAGTLSKLISASEKNTITDLTVRGTLNGDDVRFIREMAGKDAESDDTDGALVNLNIADISLTNGGGAYYEDSWSSYYTSTSYDVSEDEDEYYCTDLSYAFSETNLVSVVWPNTMWEVGTDALSYCEKLTTFTLGTSTNEIMDRAFYGCSKLAGIELTDAILYVDGYAFANCTSLKSITIPDDVETIYRNTFDGCKSLETVALGSGVKDIREKAFNGCSALKAIELPTALTKIGDSAFDGCSSLTSIVLPKKLRTLGEAVFEGCTGLAAINVASGNAYFASVEGVLFNKAKTDLLVCPVGKKGVYTVPEGTDELSASSFSRCAGLTSIVLPETLTTIGDEAFYRCNGLTELTIPNSVTSIGENAFYRCANLKAINLGTGLKKIGASTFYYCNGLETVVIPEGVTEIGYEAFSSCSALKHVEMPSTLTYIGATAFGECGSLEKVTAKMVKPVDLSADAFSGVNMDGCKLYVPAGSVDAYKADAQWGKFKDIEALINTGVSGTLANANIAVSVADGVLSVKGDVKMVEVYDMSGSAVYAGSEHSIALPQRGVYIVVADGSIVKVAY